MNNKEKIGDGSVRCCDNGDMDEKHKCKDNKFEDVDREFDEKFDKVGKYRIENIKKPLKAFLRQKLTEATEKAYTEGLNLRKDYTDIKPEILKKERERGRGEVMEKLDKTMGVIHQQYKDSLNKENHDEANGYAGALAITKHLFLELQAKQR